MPEAKKSFVERLFAQHRGALQAFFYRRIKAKHDAADLVQEVYLRILRVKDADAIRNPEGYLYTVASNLVYEHSILESSSDGLHRPGTACAREGNRAHRRASKNFSIWKPAWCAYGKSWLNCRPSAAPPST